MNQFEQNITTVSLYWELMTKFPPPEERYIRGWLRTASLDTIMAEIDSIVMGIRNGYIKSAASAGRIVSANLRRQRDGDEIRVLRFD